MNDKFSSPRIIVALDLSDLNTVKALVKQLNPKQCRLKVGKELFIRGGPQWVESLVAAGFAVFLDLKFYDIPNTVAKAVAAAAELGVWMIDVHAQGGRRMLEAARNALEQSTVSQKPLLVAVTMLTSMVEQDLRELLDWTQDAGSFVLRLAFLAREIGIDGVVCSPQELSLLRLRLGKNFCLVTPGIRPVGSSTDDQKRVMTPQHALQAGANYIVIGRPITQAKDPAAMLNAITLDITA